MEIALLQNFAIMSFEVTGKIVAIYDTVQRTETFRTREFAIEKSEDINGRVITNYIKFQCVQDRTAILDRMKVGEEVKVQFNLKGTRWEKNGAVNYITNLDAWRIEAFAGAAPQQQPQQPAQAAKPAGDFDPYSMQTSEAADDLPF